MEKIPNPFAGHPYREGVNESEKNRLRGESLGQDLKDLFLSIDRKDEHLSKSQRDLAITILKHVEWNPLPARVDSVGLAADLGIPASEVDKILKSSKYDWDALQVRFEYFGA